MNLTGKAKEEFEKWLIIGQQDYDFLYLGNCGECNGFVDFNSIPTSMQYGVYQDFFQNYDIYVYIQYYIKWNCWGWSCMHKYHGGQSVNHSEDIDDAQTKSINKANEIYNERN